MKNKLNFFDWFAQRESFGFDENPSTDYIKEYVKVHAWNVFSKNAPIHDGDCMDRPYTCNLCALEDLLYEYRCYFFDKPDKDGDDIFYPELGFMKIGNDT